MNILNVFMMILLGVDYASMSGEKKLITKMLKDYKKKGKIGRPVRNVQDTVVVKYGLALIQIMSLDEKNQILTVNVWAKYTWVDEMLIWNPKNFSNVEEVRMPPDKIWTPDIVLYNYSTLSFREKEENTSFTDISQDTLPFREGGNLTIADERLIEKRDVMVSVNYIGRIIWMPPAIFKSTCGIDISNFPFDFQSCYLKFGSWTYKGDKLDIQLYENFSEIDIIDYTESNEWLILHKPARRFVLKHTKDNTSQPDLTFFLILKRNSAYHAYLLVVPCVLLSLLTLVIFWLPPESPAKMILGMNIFVAFSLLLRLLAETTPSASTSVPYLGYYYCLNMILITLSTFLSIIVINLYFRCDKRRNLPDWLRKGVNATSKILGMKQVISSASSEKLHLIKSEIKNARNHIKRQQEKETTESRETIPTPISPHARHKSNKMAMEMQNLSGSSSNYQTRFQYPRQMTDVTDIPNTAISEIPRNSFNPSYSYEYRYSNAPPPPPLPSSTAKKQTQQKKSNQSAILLEKNLSEIRKALKNLMTKIAEKDRGNRIAKEWRMVAMVLDRLFFWVYFVIVILSGLILLLPRGLPKSMEEILEEYARKYEK